MHGNWDRVNEDPRDDRMCGVWRPLVGSWWQETHTAKTHAYRKWLRLGIFSWINFDFFFLLLQDRNYLTCFSRIFIFSRQKQQNNLLRVKQLLLFWIWEIKGGLKGNSLGSRNVLNGKLNRHCSALKTFHRQIYILFFAVWNKSTHKGSQATVCAGDVSSLLSTCSFSE